MKKIKKSKPTMKGEPVFLYTSACCGVQAIKLPCANVGMRSKEAETQGLGTFRCSSCHKACKCGRTKNGKISLDKSGE